MPPRTATTAAQLTEEEIALFRQWVASRQAGTDAISGPVKPYEALTHLSVHRDREPGEPRGMAGADLHIRGSKVWLDDARAERLLALGAIRPWQDKEAGAEVHYPLARDMTGKAFPVPPQPPTQDEVDAAKAAIQESTTLTGRGTDESTDPQPPPMAQDPTSAGQQVTDPYAPRP